MSADGGCRCISRNLEFIQAFPGVIRRTGAEVKSMMELSEFVANLHGYRRNGFRIVMERLQDRLWIGSRGWKLESGDRWNVESEQACGWEHRARGIVVEVNSSVIGSWR